MAPGDIYCDVETDKATMAWESQEDGGWGGVGMGAGAREVWRARGGGACGEQDAGGCGRWAWQGRGWVGFWVWVQAWVSGWLAG